MKALRRCIVIDKQQLALDSLALIKDIKGIKGKPKLNPKEAYERCLEMQDKYPGIGWMDTAIQFRIKMDEKEIPF